MFVSFLSNPPQYLLFEMRVLTLTYLCMLKDKRENVSKNPIKVWKINKMKKRHYIIIINAEKWKNKKSDKVTSI